MSTESSSESDDPRMDVVAKVFPSNDHLADSLICVSNAESMEEAFPGWTRNAYLGPTAQVPYRPYDLNMPLKILR